MTSGSLMPAPKTYCCVSVPEPLLLLDVLLAVEVVVGRAVQAAGVGDDLLDAPAQGIVRVDGDQLAVWT